jgi:hypothetical protein
VNPDQLTSGDVTIDVQHRLALAIEPVDASTRGPAASVRAGRETSRSMDRFRRRLGGPAEPLAGSGSRFVIRHGPGLPESGPVPPPGAPPRGPRLRIRLDDPRRRWVPRRLDAEIWTADDVRASDRPTAPGPYRSAASRLIRPWLLPGSGYPIPAGATGLRLRVTRAGQPVPWVRVHVLDAAATALIGWAHGDDRGEVLLLLDGLGPDFPPGDSAGNVTLRVHRPGPAGPPPGRDPLRGLAIEPLDRVIVPAGGRPPVDDILRGLAVPAGYLTAPDQVRPVFLGTVQPAPDLVLA